MLSPNILFQRIILFNFLEHVIHLIKYLFPIVNLPKYTVMHSVHVILFSSISVPEMFVFKRQQFIFGPQLAAKSCGSLVSLPSWPTYLTTICMALCQPSGCRVRFAHLLGDAGLLGISAAFPELVLPMCPPWTLPTTHPGSGATGQIEAPYVLRALCPVDSNFSVGFSLEDIFKENIACFSLYGPSPSALNIPTAQAGLLSRCHRGSLVQGTVSRGHMRLLLASGSAVSASAAGACHGERRGPAGSLCHRLHPTETAFQNSPHLFPVSYHHPLGSRTLSISFVFLFEGFG